MEQATAFDIPRWTLGDRLRKAREHAGLSTAALGTDLGLHRNSIGAYERDQTEPKRAVLMAWALRCGVPFEWLVSGEAPPSDDGGGTEVLQASRCTRPPDHGTGVVAYLPTARIEQPAEQAA